MGAGLDERIARKDGGRERQPLGLDIADELTMFSSVITHIGTGGFPSGLLDCIFMLMNSISADIAVDATCPP